MEEENKQNKGNSLQILTILGIIIVTAALVGGGVYFWMQSKEDKTSTNSQTTTKESTKTEEEPSVSPTKVTENFILATLGTVLVQKSTTKRLRLIHLKN